MSLKRMQRNIRWLVRRDYLKLRAERKRKKLN
jgi:hypothetical protein